jgi:outer membrane protein assembly factor BamB
MVTTLLPPTAFGQTGHSPQTTQSGAPRLLWQSNLNGYERIEVLASGGGRVAVAATPRSRMENGAWVPHAIRLTAFDIKTGAVAWRKAILGGDLTAVADDSRLYIRTQLPIVSYDGFDFKPEDLKYQIVTFRWSDGRMGWRTPDSGSRTMLAWNGRLYYEAGKGGAAGSEMVAVDAASGHEIWRSPRPVANGLFPAHDVLYAYDDSRDSDGEFLSKIDLSTGRTAESLLIYPQFRPTTHLSALQWIDGAKVMAAAIEQNSTPGINIYQIRALDAASKPAWEVQNAGRYKLVGKVLVCQNYRYQHEFPDGIVALDPANGHVLWRRNDITNEYGDMDIDFGEWHGQAVVLNGRTLLGLDPRTGKTVWTLDTQIPRTAGTRMQTQIVDGIILVAAGSQGGRPARVRGYGLAARPRVAYLHRE